jgi:hypothetical protein
MSADPKYLFYGPDVEIIAPDEHVTFDELSRTMQHITRHMATRYRHAYRPVPEKSHGLLVGTLRTKPDLSPFLAQGLFSRPGAHPVIMRFSTNPCDMLADNVSSPRGLAIKVLNVDGPKVSNHIDGTTQDFVCINANAFTSPDPKGFLEQIKTFDKNLDTPEDAKHAISLAARATNAVLKAVHLPSATLEGIGASATHILGESFSTVAPVRYGEYVAKIGFAPGSDNLKRLTGESIDLGADYNALEELIKKFFRDQTAVWDVKVQLALAPDKPATAEKDKAFRSKSLIRSGRKTRVHGRPSLTFQLSHRTPTPTLVSSTSTRDYPLVRGTPWTRIAPWAVSCEHV